MSGNSEIQKLLTGGEYLYRDRRSSLIFWPLLQQFPPTREDGLLARRAKRQAN